MSGSAPPSDPAPRAATEQRCPRCGGVARARPRRPASGNPFLSLKKESTEITCEDCGLDFDPQDDTSEPVRSSKSSPWGKS